MPVSRRNPRPAFPGSDDGIVNVSPGTGGPLYGPFNGDPTKPGDIQGPAPQPSPEIDPRGPQGPVITPDPSSNPATTPPPVTPMDPTRAAVEKLYNAHSVKNGGRGSGFTDEDYWVEQANKSGGWSPYWENRLGGDLSGTGPDEVGPDNVGKGSGGSHALGFMFDPPGSNSAQAQTSSLRMPDVSSSMSSPMLDQIMQQLMALKFGK